MKENKDGWPEKFHPISLPERLCRIGHFLTDQFRHVGISEHGRGGGPALDRALYDNLGETHDGLTVRECPDISGRDVHLIGLNQMYFPEEEA